MSTTATQHQPIQLIQQRQPYKHQSRGPQSYFPYQPLYNNKQQQQQQTGVPPLRVIQPVQVAQEGAKQPQSLGVQRKRKDAQGDTGGGPTVGAMSMQRFCLRWNNHQTNLLSVFDQLLHDESFVDVTLAVEGQFLRAHKMVLSACSPYFQALFTSHPDKHPIVILKDVPYADMRSLLDFMYRGEVSVDQDRLTAFLRVAECLRIKGLTEVNEDSKPNLNSTSDSHTTPHNTQHTSHHTHQSSSAVHHAPPPNTNLNYAQIQQHRLQHQQQQQHLVQAHIQQQQQQLQQAAAAAAAGKRFNVNHMLGSGGSGGNVLMQHQPKRKRGRPRKLSGSSTGGVDEFETGEGAGNDGKRTGNSLVQGPPELLEVKMSVDGFPTASNASDGSASDRERGDDGRDDEDELIIATHSSPERGTTRNDGGEEGAGSGGGGGSREDGGGEARVTSKDGETIADVDQSIVKTEYTINETIKLEPSDNLNNNTNHPSTSRTPPTQSARAPPANQTAPTNTTNSLTPNNNNNNNNNNSSASSFTTPQSSGRQPVKRRARRRTSSSCQDPAEQLTEMSVRGLNLFRYASINEGIYHCTECAKVDVQKTFKNKYSFQRHAFLYHEGHQRKVFPCPVCQKEFSRPDKMKNHMKTVHDCFMPKDCVFPMGFFLPPSV